MAQQKDTPSGIRPLDAWGERVDALRAARGLSWNALYKAAGVDKSLGRKYVTGGSAPGEAAIERFAAALEVKPVVLQPLPRAARVNSTRAELAAIRSLAEQALAAQAEYAERIELALSQQRVIASRLQSLGEAVEAISDAVLPQEKPAATRSARTRRR